MIKLTIITVCYNDLANLKKTLASLDNQTVKTFKQLIIDGHSTDGTIEYLTTVPLSYPMHFITEPDHGIYDAMNKGVTLASGDFLWFLNAGDTAYNQDTVANILKNLQVGLGILFGNTQIIGPNFAYSTKIKDHLTPKDFIMRLPTSHQSMIFNKQLLPIPTFNLRYTIAADYNLVVHLLHQNLTYQTCPEVIANYVLGGHSANNWVTSIYQYLEIAKKYFGKKNIYVPFIISLSRHYMSCILKKLHCYNSYKKCHR